jgi:hypothetical protein
MGIRDVTRRELQAIQAVARFEGEYGFWSKSKSGQNSNNWGAIQCKKSRPPCKPGCFEHKDHDADGKPYQHCFREYDTPTEGAMDLVKEIYARKGARAAARRGDATALANAMRKGGYFESPADKYALAIELHAKEVAKRLKEPVLVKRRSSSSSNSNALYAIAAMAIAGWLLTRG